jgi:hypothetical protein
MGRLSMWRAYGLGSGVALVLKNDVFLALNPGLDIYAFPVVYGGEQEIESLFRTVAGNLANEPDLIRSMSREEVKGRIFGMLYGATVATKHPIFEEEREWRIVYWPKEENPVVKRETKLIGNLPQPVCVIPLESHEKIGLDLRIPRLFDRLIIGPTSYPIAMGYAFQALLEEAGVSDAESRISIPQIPLRT